MWHFPVLLLTRTTKIKFLLSFRVHQSAEIKPFTIYNTCIICFSISNFILPTAFIYVFCKILGTKFGQFSKEVCNWSSVFSLMQKLFFWVLYSCICVTFCNVKKNFIFDYNLFLSYDSQRQNWLYPQKALTANPSTRRPKAAAARLLGLGFQIPPGEWLSLPCESWLL